jgi:1,5-anhydro-D-fructose reductase (1,5-anhydro-D-mannitol-forming)
MILGWAILGAGRFAASRIAPALNRAHGCKAIAVISRERARAEAFAGEFGIPRAYDDLGAALADPQIEAVWVATPHALHRDAVLALAKAGRHVLCEKPLATDPAAAAEMVRACRQAGVALGTGFHLHHHPLHQELRRLIAGGRAGNVISADAEWSLGPRAEAESAEWRWDRDVSGGGVFTATGVHALDLLRFVLDDEVAAVSATLDPPPTSAEVERRLIATLWFRRGVIATVRSHRGVYAPANDLLLECQHASLRARHTLDEQARGVLELDGVGGHMAGVPVGTDLYALQAEAFSQAVGGGREPSASGLDGQRCAEVTQAIYQSAATGRAVRLSNDL